MPVQVSPRRVNDVLNNLEIVFIDCKFIFSALPIASSNTAQIQTEKKKRRTAAHNLLNKVSKVLSEEKNIYEKCIFGSQENDIKKQIKLYSNEHVRYTFVNCRFIKRESRSLENIGFKFRNWFGIMFETDYLHGNAEIINYHLKIKYIPKWTAFIIEQMSKDA